MYVYKSLFNVGVLIIKFSGNYLSDDARQSLLDIARLMNPDEIYAINTVILDLKDVTSMTLANTDKARMAYWQREIFSVIKHPKKDVAAHLAAVKIFHVLPENNVVKDMFFKRVTKLSPEDRITEIRDDNFHNLVDVLEQLDLLDHMPLPAEGWKEGKLRGIK